MGKHEMGEKEPLRVSNDSGLDDRDQELLFAWFWRPAKWKWIAVSMILLVGISATAARAWHFHQVPTHGKFDRSSQGYCDFHQGVYFPAQAFLNRISPYSPEFVEHYPVPRPMPLFTPSVLLLHSPLGLFEKWPIEIVFFTCSLLLLLVIAYLSVRYSAMKFSWYAVLLIAAVMVYSRAGHSTLFTGYFTLEIVIGVLLALHFGHTKPWLAGLGLFLAAIKPTFAIPLALIMLSRGHVRAAISGTVISIVVSAAAVGWLLSASSPGELVEGARLSQELHESDPNEMPVNSWVRVDALALVAKWLEWNPSGMVHLAVMIPILLLVAPWLWMLSQKQSDHQAFGIAGLLSSLTLIVSIYHQFYDALILVAPVVGVISATGNWQSVWRPLRYAIVLFSMVPACNYLSAEIFLNRFVHSDVAYRVVTSISPVCTLVAFGLVGLLAVHRSRRDESSDARPNVDGGVK